LQALTRDTLSRETRLLRDLHTLEAALERAEERLREVDERRAEVARVAKEVDRKLEGYKRKEGVLRGERDRYRLEKRAVEGFKGLAQEEVREKEDRIREVRGKLDRHD